MRQAWHQPSKHCKKHKFALTLNLKCIDNGCIFDLVLVMHSESGYFMEHLWGMSTVLDSAVKVVWQTGRKRECNRVYINAISQVPTNENGSYCKAESDLSYSTCWQLCPWVACMGNSWLNLDKAPQSFCYCWKEPTSLSCWGFFKAF